jgi:hypothetical protein
VNFDSINRIRKAVGLEPVTSRDADMVELGDALDEAFIGYATVTQVRDFQRQRQRTRKGDMRNERINWLVGERLPTIAAQLGIEVKRSRSGTPKKGHKAPVRSRYIDFVLACLREGEIGTGEGPDGTLREYQPESIAKMMQQHGKKS